MIVALASHLKGYSVLVALTGLLIGYSVIVALTGLPIGYSVIVALTGLPLQFTGTYSIQWIYTVTVVIMLCIISRNSFFTMR